MYILNKILVLLLLLSISACSIPELRSISPKLKVRNSFEQKLASKFGKEKAKIIIKYDLFNLSSKKCMISDLYSDVFNQKVSLNRYQNKINNAYAEFKMLTESDLENNVYQKLNDIAKRYNMTAHAVGLSPAKYKPKKDKLFKMLGVAQKVDKKFRAVPIIHPVKKYIVTSHYGQRIHPIKGITKLHSGIDLISKADHYPIYAANDGRVIFAGEKSGYGNSVIIDHGNNVKTFYAHLSKIVVKKGAGINAGQVIGIMGDSGTATATHLHYEIRVNNAAINPAPLLKFNNCSK